MFKFTLRRAEGTPLGLEVQPDKADRVLRVRSVVPGGAVEAWNKQSGEGSSSWKVVRPGDLIVQANKAIGTRAILEEIRYNHLLQLVVVREEAALHPAGGQQAVAHATTAAVAVPIHSNARSLFRETGPVCAFGACAAAGGGAVAGVGGVTWIAVPVVAGGGLGGYAHPVFGGHSWLAPVRG